jgi:hypothetical protein
MAKDILLLDTTCLMGTHRLLACVYNFKKNNIDKIIIPYSVLIQSGLPQHLMFEFSTYISYITKTNSQKYIYDLLLQDRDNVLETIEELKKIGLIETPEYDDWHLSNSNELVTYNKIRENIFSGFIGLSKDEAQRLDIIVADLEMFTAAFFRGYEITTYNRDATNYIINLMNTVCDIRQITCNELYPIYIKPSSLENYINYLDNQEKIQDIYTSSFHTIIKNIVLILTKGIAGFIPFLSDTINITETSKKIREKIIQLRHERKLYQISNLYLDTKYKNEKIKLIEMFIKFVNEIGYKTRDL